MGYEQEENSTEQYTETYAHKSSKSPIKGVVRYELLAGLAGGIVPMPPAEALQTSRTCGPGHRTICYLAAFIHNITLLEISMLFKLMVLFLFVLKL